MKDGLPQSGFWALMFTQALTVLNDNWFKQVMLLLALDLQRSGQAEFCTDMQACVGFAFAVPFLMFAAIAGDVADTHSKRKIVLLCKVSEALVMLAAAVAFLTESLPLLMLVLFLMGVQSAFLGPAKYGALVEMQRPDELARGNGIMQAFLLAALLLGLGSAGALYDWTEAGAETGSQYDRLAELGLGFALVAVIGAVVARRLPQLAAARPGAKMRWNPLPPTLRGWKLASRTPGMLPAVLGHALYWMLGAILVFAWNEMGRDLGQEEGPWTARLATMSMSTAVGCIVAGKLARATIPLFVPLVGGLGLGLSFLAVAAGPQEPSAIYLSLLIGSFFAGLYLIPLRTLVQRLPPESETGRAIGFSQFSDWTGIVLASLAQTIMKQQGLSSFEAFWVLGAALCLGTVLVIAMMRRQLGTSVARLPH